MFKIFSGKELTPTTPFEKVAAHTEIRTKAQQHMRTKTLILTAALTAAGMTAGMAQVFSVNAVGYVKKTVPAGQFALLNNPLNATGDQGNTLAAVLPDATANTVVFEFDPATGGFAQYTFRDIGGGTWTGSGADSATLDPGEGFFIKAPDDADLELVFVGEVPQGTLNVDLPAGFSLVGSAVPQAGAIEDDLGVPAEDGDVLFQFTETGFVQATRRTDSIGWTPSQPNLDVAEGVFYNATSEKTWTRDFDVNSQ